jgi:hypothetical protein
MNARIDETEEEIMAPRKTTAEAGRGTSRKAQDATGDQAGLVALTTTLLAGAVTGAVAGLVEEADARNPRQEPATPPAGAGSVEPDQTRHANETPAGHDAAVGGLQPAEAARTDALPTPAASLQAAPVHAGPMIEPGPMTEPNPHAPHQPQADVGAISAMAEPDLVSSVADVAGPTAHTTVAQTPSQGGSSAASGSAPADQHAALVSGFDAAGDGRATALLDHISGRLDDAIAGIGGGDAELAQIDEVVSSVTDALGSVGDALNEAFAGTGVPAIPASILGAGRDARQPDGLLAELFDLETVAPSSGTGPAHRSDPGDTGLDLVHAGASGLAGPPAALSDFGLPDLTGAVDAVRIGFAGQPYSESPEAHDGPAGSHANLLHGLL